jgi:hypothetical protein
MNLITISWLKLVMLMKMVVSLNVKSNNVFGMSKTNGEPITVLKISVSFIVTLLIKINVGVPMLLIVQKSYNTPMILGIT